MEAYRPRDLSPTSPKHQTRSLPTHTTWSCFGQSYLIITIDFLVELRQPQPAKGSQVEYEEQRRRSPVLITPFVSLQATSAPIRTAQVQWGDKKNEALSDFPA